MWILRQFTISWNISVSWTSLQNKHLPFQEKILSSSVFGEMKIWRASGTAVEILQFASLSSPGRVPKVLCRCSKEVQSELFVCSSAIHLLLQPSLDSNKKPFWKAWPLLRRAIWAARHTPSVSIVQPLHCTCIDTDQSLANFKAIRWPRGAGSTPAPHAKAVGSSYSFGIGSLSLNSSSPSYDTMILSCAEILQECVTLKRTITCDSIQVYVIPVLFDMESILLFKLNNIRNSLMIAASA